MNRKEFLKNLVLGSIGIAVAPSVLAETTTRKRAIPEYAIPELANGVQNNTLAPYKISLKNITDKTLYDIELFNANKNINNKKFGLPLGIGFQYIDLAQLGGGATYVNYLKLLYQAQSQPLNIPVIYLKINKTAFGTRDLDFKVVKYNPITNKPDSMTYIWGYWSPYQFNDSEVLVKLADKNRICLDFRTAIVIPKLERGAEIELHFYTQQMIDKMPVSNMFAKGFDDQFLEMSKPPYF